MICLNNSHGLASYEGKVLKQESELWIFIVIFAMHGSVMIWKLWSLHSQLEMYFTEKQQSCFISVVCDWQTSKLKSLKEISQKCIFKTAGKNSKLWGWSALNQILPTSRLHKLGAKVLYLLSFYVFELIYEKSHITESNRTQVALTERHNYHSMKFYKEDEIW